MHGPRFFGYPIGDTCTMTYLRILIVAVSVPKKIIFLVVH